MSADEVAALSLFLVAWSLLYALLSTQGRPGETLWRRRWRVAADAALVFVFAALMIAGTACRLLL